MKDTTILFQKIAQTEFIKAKKWYAERSVVVASNFSLAVDRAVIRIQEHSERLPKIGRKYQYAPVNRFPYILIFRKVDDKTFAVVAVAHTKRRKGYWSGR